MSREQARAAQLVTLHFRFEVDSRNIEASYTSAATQLHREFSEWRAKLDGAPWHKELTSPDVEVLLLTYTFAIAHSLYCVLCIVHTANSRFASWLFWVVPSFSYWDTAQVKGLVTEARTTQSIDVFTSCLALCRCS